jgi:ElaB/YqjD/DUF883 family membrane-anchored ribosome-binding protein
VASGTEADIEALKGEMKQLRAEFTKLGDILKNVVHHGREEAGERVRATAEQVWDEASARAAGLTKKIEEQPVTAAFAAFGIGMLIGLLFSSRR